MEEAKTLNATTIASFGGPYSNHLVALAFVAKLNGLKSIGYIRTNKGEPITSAMHDAMNYGMEFIFLGRGFFQEKKKELLNKQVDIKNSDTYFVDEGGYGIIGAKGAATIITEFDFVNRTPEEQDDDGYEKFGKSNSIYKYDYLVCAVGTGTMIAGLINAANTNQTVIGIPVLKNEESIENEIRNLLNNQKVDFKLLHTFHQGGYAKTTEHQINFMNSIWDNHFIPTDIVYTGKVFFAVNELVKQNYFKEDSSVLVIHSGGLQGNRSLAKGILHF
jgi:1-aminocyclopropane-1-carboxylate deaminase